MKQTIVILISVLVFCSCLTQTGDGCPGYLRLSFTHEGTGQGFDQAIGNDVILHIYKDDILQSTRTLPYSQISGGQQYVIKKEFSGTADIVAWAVPRTGNPNLIPTYVANEQKSRKSLKMTAITRSAYYESMDNLYLGTANFDIDIERETSLNVPMLNCICKVSVTVTEDSDFFTPGQIETPRIEVLGSKSEMNMDLDGIGEDAIVFSDLTYNGEEKILTSDVLGLLPSADNQTLSVLGYRGNTAVFRVDTQYKSVPGTDIHILVSRGPEVILTINGWRVFDVTITEL